MFFEMVAPDGSKVFPIHDDCREACWAMGKSGVSDAMKNGTLIWKNRGTDEEPKWIPYTREFAPETPTRPYPTIWTDLLSTRQAKAHQKSLLPEGTEPFSTPKTEQLLQRIIEMCTDEGDIVLDSFAGSGTTGAVAHKMHRRWIMVELGEHCQSHILPRLKKVIEGRDDGGISSTRELVWETKLNITKLRNPETLLEELAQAEEDALERYQRFERKIEDQFLRLYGELSASSTVFGGGFRYFTLAPSLLEKDKFGNWIINKKYNKEMLVEALCKLEGFQYEPSESVYWQHGHSTESDFIYVTTQTLTKEQIQKLSDEVGPSRSLLICCGAYRIRNLEEYENLTLKKIPRAVMAKCEWGKDDYSLEIKELAPAPEPDPDPNEPERPKPKRRRAKPVDGQLGLFEMGGAE